MNSGKNVFIIGPGLIGWNVLELLVAESYKVTALVRRKEHAEGIKQSGATSILGDLNDAALISDQTSRNDITIHTATADHLPSVEAVLTGIKKRAQDGYSTIFIHTSGTGILDDGANGGFKGEKIYHDDKPEQIDDVSDDAPHRRVDLAIVKAKRELGSKAKLAIMIPPEIYGFDSKHNRLSIQVPTLTRFALKHGFAGHVGQGLSVESQIHFHDLSRAYVVLLQWLESADPASEEIQNPYFFCENGREFSWREVGEEIGRALYQAGKIRDPEAREIPEGMWEDLFGAGTGATIGLNSRSRAARLRKMGWEAMEKGIWEAFREDELPEILKDEGVEFRGYRTIGGA